MSDSESSGTRLASGTRKRGRHARTSDPPSASAPTSPEPKSRRLSEEDPPLASNGLDAPAAAFTAPTSPAPLAEAVLDPSAEEEYPISARGYVAEFLWSKHYPYAEVDPEVAPKRTALQTNLPAMFFHILSYLQEVELKYRSRNLLPLFDRRLVGPVDQVPENLAEKRYAITDPESRKWVVIANRKENLKLFYDCLKDIDLCPKVVAVHNISQGKSTVLFDRLRCRCPNHEAQEDEEEEEELLQHSQETPALAPGSGSTRENEEFAASAGRTFPSTDHEADEGAGDDAYEMDGDNDDADAYVQENYTGSGGGNTRRSSRIKKKSSSSSKKQAAAAASAVSSAGVAPSNGRHDEASFHENEEFVEDHTSLGENAWESVLESLRQARKKVEESWRVKLRDANERLILLQNQLEEAEENSHQYSKKWMQELQKTEALWSRLAILQNRLNISNSVELSKTEKIEPLAGLK